ncbi:MAG: nuclear transport factor 2 family protein [Hyphomicrobiales bacterium]|nr:nuclear transport factor 2 family protein [Hyphomicrobiales bacterium]
MNAVDRTGASARPYLDKIYEVDIESDVTYGVGGVGYESAKGAARHRDLKLDIYRPRTSEAGLRPALILAFGGAFHRGSKSVEVFEGENPSTAMAEYCREFARRGYICFSIDYRLMQEDPDPGVTPFLPPNLPFKAGRIDVVRGILGLPPCTAQMMFNTLEAATDDMSKAVAFVRSRAPALNVDLSRIAIGGFSAGASIALNAAYGENAPVAAVVSISGRTAAKLDVCIQPGSPPPPALMLYGEDDLPDILNFQAPMGAAMTKAGIDNSFLVVPKANHFYLRTAGLTGADGRPSDVETEIAAFLYDRLRLSSLGAGAMSVARLQAFADAWNRHDIDDLMSFMTDDCVFQANAGGEVFGTTYAGREDVRRGYMKAWQTYPDARWNNARHAVCGDRGFSEWVFTGVGPDAQKVEIAGCDLFEFRGDKIVVKNSFRKRPA